MKTRMSSISAETSAKIANMGIICAFLVLFIHLPAIGNESSLKNFIRYFTRGVGKMAVPFFFVASGYLLAGHFGEEGWYRKEVIKRVRTLLLPMVLWSALFFLWRRLMLPVWANFLHGESLFADVVLRPKLGEIARILVIHPFAEPYLGVLWFMRMLFILVMFSPVLKKLATPSGVICLYVLQALVGPELGGTPSPLRFTFLKGFFPVCGAAFFCLGILLRERRWRLTVPKPYGAMALGISLFAIALRGEPYATRKAMLITWAYVPFLIVAAWSFCPVKRFPDVLARAALPVYLMHMFAIPLMAHLFPCTGVFSYCACGFSSFLLCVGGGWALRKAFPRISAMLFGGR